jgi:hypothetical protein
MSKDTSVPAFPSHGSMGEVSQEGMTLRDYFAAKATDADIEDAMLYMQRVDRILESHNGQKQIIKGLPDNARQIARYMHADAMLRAREAE